jgi:hypothetical protein
MIVMHSSRYFLVVQCEPAIEDLHVLLEQLNQDNRFNVFVKTIRNRFKEMCR